MKQKIFLTLAFLFFVNSLFSQSIQLHYKIYESYDKLKEGYENLSKVQSIVKDIEGGGNPDINSYGSDWSVLSNSYKQAAELIKNALTTGDYNLSPYSISINDINNCHLSKDNINKLTNYKIRMDVSYTRGLEELNNMAEYKKLVEKSFLAIKYLIDVNVKLSKTQAYNKIFQWNWFDLETSVRPALGELLAEVNKREKRLRQEVEKVKLHSSNLGSNISLLESSICRINGTYTGNLSSGRQGNITLILNPDYGNSGSVTYSYRENNLNYSYTWTFPYITISSGQYISIKAKLGNKTANLSGRLSQDYMQILDFNGTDSHTSSSNIPSTTLRK